MGGGKKCTTLEILQHEIASECGTFPKRNLALSTPGFSERQRRMRRGKEIEGSSLFICNCEPNPFFQAGVKQFLLLLSRVLFFSPGYLRDNVVSPAISHCSFPLLSKKCCCCLSFPVLFFLSPSLSFQLCGHAEVLLSHRKVQLVSFMSLFGSTRNFFFLSQKPCGEERCEREINFWGKRG